MKLKPKEKKKVESLPLPQFDEIAKGKVYNVKFPKNNFTWIDMRSEEQKKAQLSLKDLGGEYSKGGKYDQLVIVSDKYLRNAKPYDVWRQISEVRTKVEQMSGSAGIAFVSSSPIVLDMPNCKKCGTPLFIVGEGYNCPKCGTPTT